MSTLVRAGDEAVEALERLVREHVDRAPDRTDEAGDGAEQLAQLALRRRTSRGPEGGLELDLVEAVVSTEQHEDRTASLDDHREGLDDRPGGDAERRRDLLHRASARGVHGDGLGQRLGQVDALRGRAGDLDVGGIAGVGERDVVLARGTGRHVLVRAGAAHHADVRLDAVPLQAGAVEDAVVGLDVQLVGVRQPLRVAVEAVGVLHDELARSQHAGARARLVALLGLEVVEDARQVAVGADLAGHVEGDVLLVGHRQHELGAAAVLQLEDLVDVVAAAGLPQLGRLDHGHQQLVRADRVELLAHDLLGLAVGAPARRQPRPHARGQLAGEPRAHDQHVRARLGVGRRLARGGQEVVRQAGHGRRESRWPRARAVVKCRRGRPMIELAMRLGLGGSPLRRRVLTSLVLVWLAYALILLLGLDGNRMLLIEDIAYYGLLLAAPAVCAARALHVPEERLAWSLLAGGLAAWVAADVFYALSGAPDSPSWADAGWLAIYPRATARSCCCCAPAPCAPTPACGSTGCSAPARSPRWWSRCCSARSLPPAPAPRPPSPSTSPIRSATRCWSASWSPPSG